MSFRSSQDNTNLKEMRPAKPQRHAAQVYDPHISWYIVKTPFLSAWRIARRAQCAA
ncbi:hypothetical protein BC629DRAFT_1503577, partial [Irpex lacteus]